MCIRDRHHNAERLGNIYYESALIIHFLWSKTYRKARCGVGHTLSHNSMSDSMSWGPFHDQDVLHEAHTTCVAFRRGGAFRLNDHRSQRQGYIQRNVAMVDCATYNSINDTPCSQTYCMTNKQDSRISQVHDQDEYASVELLHLELNEPCLHRSQALTLISSRLRHIQTLSRA